LPSDFPKWRTVHAYFAIWSEPREGASLLEKASKKQVGAAREKQERNASSAFLVVDAQSVKNTDTAALNGYDTARRSRTSSATLQWTPKGCRTLLR
jgi:hypothetical protein